MKHTYKEENKAEGFYALCDQLNGGYLLEQIEDALKGCANTARNVGKEGKVMIEFQFSPVVDNAGTQIFVSCKVSKKLPEHSPKKSLFFVGADGELTRENPKQTEFGF
jgi:hypothetical protein